jgi:hypothetical protein
MYVGRISLKLVYKEILHTNLYLPADLILLYWQLFVYEAY